MLMNLKLPSSASRLRRIGAVCALIPAVWVPAGLAQITPAIPHLGKQGTATQLIVHGAPLLMLGGELGNSSASDPTYMVTVWPKLAAMHLNTVLMPVYWELCEPEEGRFDFALADNLIDSARAGGLKVVVLWFGSWKNSMSCYAPSWVKTNQKRFPRARTGDGRAEEILTPFSDENRNADARAFAAFMKHLRAFDGDRNTVVMIQVENEIGMIPGARDRSAGAEESFKEEVPGVLTAYLEKNRDSLTEEVRRAWGSSGWRRSGTWEEIFGAGAATEEIFMAWHFARYANDVAQAGKNEYPLPMYVNAALIRPGYRPGQYPSGGPLPHLMDVWRAAAPQIDFLAPDIYFPDFAGWLGKYDRGGNAVFVPEVDRHQSVANAFYAFARHSAMGYNPFSIESTDDPAHSRITGAYEVLRQITPLILSHQGTGTMAGFLLDGPAQTANISLGGYRFTVKHELTWPYAAPTARDTPRSGGMIIMTAKDEFYVAGSGVVVTFESSAGDGSIAGVEAMDEGAFVDGKWRAGRRMNGDQDHQGRHMYLPGTEYGIQKVRLYTYK